MSASKEQKLVRADVYFSEQGIQFNRTVNKIALTFKSYVYTEQDHFANIIVSMATRSQVL